MVWGFILLLRLKNKNKVFKKSVNYFFSINERCLLILLLQFHFFKYFIICELELSIKKIKIIQQKK